MDGARDDVVRLEPLGDLLDVTLLAIVKVLACTEEFNGLRSAFYQRIEHRGVQAVFNANIGGDCSEHSVFLNNRTFLLIAHCAAIVTGVCSAQQMTGLGVNLNAFPITPVRGKV